jgi:hypothetical protein
MECLGFSNALVNIAAAIFRMNVLGGFRSYRSERR